MYGRREVPIEQGYGTEDEERKSKLHHACKYKDVVLEYPTYWTGYTKNVILVML
jgi:hypothetical protein